MWCLRLSEKAAFFWRKSIAGTCTGVIYEVDPAVKARAVRGQAFDSAILGEGFGGGFAAVPAFGAEAAVAEFFHCQVFEIGEAAYQVLLIFGKLLPIADLHRVASGTLRFGTKGLHPFWRFR